MPPAAGDLKLRYRIALSVPVSGAVIALAAPLKPVAVSLLATALYMGGAGHPLSIPQDTTGYIASYVSRAANAFVTPSGLCSGGDPGCVPLTVFTPEQSRFDGDQDMTHDESVAVGLANLDACLRGIACTVTDPPYVATGIRSLGDSVYVVFGYSQSAIIATIEKRRLISDPLVATVSFVVMGNSNRPNGGILERFAGARIPGLGIAFDGATPTDSPRSAPMTTVDIARQYDPTSDFPTNPLNLLADLNALLGVFQHPEGFYFDGGTPQLQGQYQDSTYYLIPATTLPLLESLTRMPGIGPVLARLLDPPLRVLVETAYDRTANPGQPSRANWRYFPNPVKTAVNFLAAIPVGLDDATAYLTADPANRPLGTVPQPVYGVGGPPVYAGAIDPYGPPTPVAGSPGATVRSGSRTGLPAHLTRNGSKHKTSAASGAVGTGPVRPPGP